MGITSQKAIMFNLYPLLGAYNVRRTVKNQSTKNGAPRLVLQPAGIIFIFCKKDPRHPVTALE